MPVRHASIALVFWVALSAGNVRAWHMEGHERVARAAVAALPDDVPAFFRAAGEGCAHCAVDPDTAKLPQLKQLRNRESPEHFIDMELLQGQALPPTRWEYVDLCRRSQLQPQVVGLLPYAVTEMTQQLAAAFAEHRRRPQDPHIHAKCVVYAGWLAHYAADLCQPLHTTVHFDGRAGDGGKSPRSGIHARVDDLLGRLGQHPVDLLDHIAVEPAADVWQAVLEELGRSHALVDRVYELEPQLPPALPTRAPGKADASQLTPEARGLAEERLRVATRFTATLYLTAWRMSERLTLPEWLVRPE